MSDDFARTPEPPYWAVIFTSRRTAPNPGYDLASEQMTELGSGQPGFLGIESVRNADGFGITVSYWESEDAIAAWKRNAEHRVAQVKGRSFWYSHYETRVAKVERAYAFTAATADES